MLAIGISCVALLLGAGEPRPNATDKASEQDAKVIAQVIHDNIAWGLTKNLDLLYNTLQQDSTLLIINPDGSYIDGFAGVEATAQSFWMDPRFKATHCEVKNLRITFSESRTAAWFFCLLDDFGEWDGKPYKWEDARWSGVLEKVNGKWVIRQMHFSFARKS